MIAPTPASGHPSPPRAGLILLALAVGGFAIGTGEFSIMGVMPEVAAGLSISEPQVGHAISTYALGVVVGAPLLAILGAHLQRRTLLLLLMSFFALGNFASALAPNYRWLMLFRFIAGLPHGAYFGIAALVAAGMVPANKRAAAISRVMLGLNVAILIGNPIATLIGQRLSWRLVFILVASIALLCVALVFRFLPAKPDEKRNHPRQELRAFNRIQVWLALGIGGIGFAGMFCVISYLAPTLLQVTHADPKWIPVALAAFGLGAIVGGLGGGWLYDRLQFKAVGGILLWYLVVLVAFTLSTGSLWTVLPATLLVGTLGGLAPALQTRLMDVAAEAQTLAAASNQAAFNMANALGPYLGGLAVGAGFSWRVTGLVGAGTAVAGLLIFMLAWKLEQKQPATNAGKAAQFDS